jgi:hypothetical protein
MLIDRINSLLRRTGGEEIQSPNQNLHFILDQVERQLGIITRHGRASVYKVGRQPFPQAEYVGARVTRLERHLYNTMTPPYFHLGAGAEA